MEKKEKNTNAIEKIISELSLRDYLAAWGKLTKKQKHNSRFGKYHFSYTLGEDTLEAIQIQRDYLSNKISEEEYKAYCLHYNLRTA